MSIDHPFDGEYWNVNEETGGITRFRFEQRTGATWVSAWGSCYPDDCEWGETKFYPVAENPTDMDKTHTGFATWDDDPGHTHILFSNHDGQLSTLCICLRDEYPSYKTEEVFRKDEERSNAALLPDYRLRKFRHMWETDGWKLVQFTEPVFFVELEFPPEGPSVDEIPMIVKFRDIYPAQTMEQFVEMMKGCTGLGIPGLFSLKRLQQLLCRPSVWQLPPTIQVIVSTDYVVQRPDGTFHCWASFEKTRCAVVERMLAAGVPIVSGKPPSDG